MAFTPTDIAYFLQIASARHFGRAAQLAGVTQPAMTKAMHRLEAAVGVRLFERGAGGARLTAEGELFLEAARQFDHQHLALQRLATDLRARDAGLLRVGLANPDGNPMVGTVLAELVRQRPGLRLALTIDTSDALDAAVDSGQLDLAVAPAYPGHRYRCAQVALGRDRVRIAARVDHPLAGLQPCRVQDLEPFGWVMPTRGNAARELLTEMLERAGIAAPTVVLEAEYVSSAVLNIVALTNLLVAAPAQILPQWAGRIQPLPLPDLDIDRNLVLLARHDARWTPVMSTFREGLLRQHAPARPARRKPIPTRYR